MHTTLGCQAKNIWGSVGKLPAKVYKNNKNASIAVNFLASLDEKSPLSHLQTLRLARGW